MKNKLQGWSRFFIIAAFVIQGFVASAEHFWFFELFTHYLPYYALIAICFTFYYLFKKNFVLTLTWVSLFIINFIPIVPYLSTTTTSTNFTSTETQELTVLAQNVLYTNSDTSEFYDRVSSLKPTIFVVNEANAIWGITQNEVLSDYPSTALTQQTGIHGIFMGSRVSGTFTEISLGQEVGLEFIPEDGSYRVLGVHPEAPVIPSWAAARNEQFADLVSYANSSTLPTVIIGDFNCTPWSPYFKDLISQSGLHDSRLGFGFKSTWKANNPIFWLPIDHALVSPNVQVLDFESFPTQISDHKAIEVQVSF